MATCDLGLTRAASGDRNERQQFSGIHPDAVSLAAVQSVVLCGVADVSPGMVVTSVADRWELGLHGLSLSPTCVSTVHGRFLRSRCHNRGSRRVPLEETSGRPVEGYAVEPSGPPCFSPNVSWNRLQLDPGTFTRINSKDNGWKDGWTQEHQASTEAITYYLAKDRDPINAMLNGGRRTPCCSSAPAAHSQFTLIEIKES
ncbi:unnamed protein product [Pleuronectes platessa]|uniref:Uncharacterized protein n=1 Tax=Pleuronectes platessa TaxID=8262 RepID=A0A9N7V1C3_PLEPL|nr:unnamed protein product [Pleuronectes platessa]